MSWPHVLSFSRIVVSPVVAVLVLSGPGDAYVLAAIIFSLASITDSVDGQLARYSQCVSPLGVFLDTTADKILVSLTLVGMAVAGLVPAWIPLVIIGREFLITGLRSFAASSDHVISAHIWGKGKAALTMIAVGLMLLAADGRAGGALARLGSHALWRHAFTVSLWLLTVAAILTVVSGIRYIVDAWPLLRDATAPRSVEQEERPRMIAGGEG